MQKNRLILKADQENISEGVSFIEKKLKAIGCRKESVTKILFLSEELLLQMVMHAEPESEIVVSVRRFLKKYILEIKCAGEKFELSDRSALDLLGTAQESEEFDKEQVNILSGIILRSFSSLFRLKHTRGMNTATMEIPVDSAGGSKLILGCILLGLLTGAVLKYLLPEIIMNFLSVNIFSLVSAVFMDGIKLIIAPLVFFSMAESLCGAEDMKVFGRMGARILFGYLCTTLAAILIGGTMFLIFQPGDPAMLSAVEKVCGSGTVAQAEISFVGTLESLIPSNFFNSFVDSNMVQIIIIAILFGVASNRIGKYSEPVQNFIKAGNAIFSEITGIIIKMLPAAVFCMMANLVIETDSASVSQILRVCIAGFCGIACILLFYALILFLFGHEDPLRFFSSYKEAMLVAFTSCSSNVAMPVSMRCLDRMGVPSKVYSFSIPLGATINMDGASMIFVLFVFFMAKIYGVQISGNLLAVLVFTVILLSAAAPGVAGGGIAMFALLLSQMGMPAEAVLFMTPVLTLFDFLMTMSNVTGDAVITTIVAKSFAK